MTCKSTDYTKEIAKFGPKLLETARREMNPEQLGNVEFVKYLNESAKDFPEPAPKWLRIGDVWVRRDDVRRVGKIVDVPEKHEWLYAVSAGEIVTDSEQYGPGSSDGKEDNALIVLQERRDALLKELMA